MRVLGNTGRNEDSGAEFLHGSNRYHTGRWISDLFVKERGGPGSGMGIMRMDFRIWGYRELFVRWFPVWGVSSLYSGTMAQM